MRKIILFAAAASVALVACTKNEVTNVSSDKEITFQTVETKAAAAFDENNKFISYAFFNAKGENWDAKNGTASPYISDAVISFNSAAKEWKAGQVYYWPKQGSLTFFAWSTNTTAKPEITGGTVNCTTAKGIEIDNFSIASNKNVDLLVAEIAKNQTQNTTQVSDWEKGVPTVFKHVLSKLIFNVQTVDDSGNGKDYSSEGVTFTVKSIKLKSVKDQLAYAQSWQTGNAPSKHEWTTNSSTEEVPITVFTGSQVATKDATALTLGAEDRYIVIPQEFDAATGTEDLLDITYEITTNYTGTAFTETVNHLVKLSEVYPENWEAGKQYTLTIKLSLNEVLWAPSVDPWVDGRTDEIHFND